MGIRINDRDLEVLSSLVEAGGLLDSQTIHQRHFPLDSTSEACLRRLRMLRSENLLDVVRASVTYGSETLGRVPLVFSLTKQGAELIEDVTGVSAKPIHLTVQNLEHRLAIAKVRLIVSDACKQEGFQKPDWIGEYEHRKTEIHPKMKLAERYRLCHQYTVDDSKYTCWPDLASMLVIKHPTGESRLQILWEIDRSTERLAQIRAKLTGYHQFFLNRDEKRLFGIAGMRTRIFFVTSSEERCKSIAELFRDQPSSERVRLTWSKALTQTSMFRGSIWFTSKWECRKIISNSNS